jgi:AcrR family transcriptional regulator
MSRVDRRVARSKRALRDALVSLALERGWDQVSIQELCERADVGRSTFYSHFGDKDELLVSGFDDLRAELRGKHPLGGPPLAFVHSLYQHALEHHRLFSAVVGKRSGAMVQARFRQLVLELTLQDLACVLPDEEEAQLRAHYLTGALLGVLTLWLERRAMAPDEVADAILRLSSTLLRPG